jgi:nucleotide-binding universal stress UspA family protein
VKQTRVVAGVDGSDQALRAVQAATRDAARRGRGLKLVHAFVWPELKVPTGPPEGGPPEMGLRHQAERFLDDAAKAAAHTDPSVPITTELVTGAAAPVLLQQAHEAEVIVLGNRGLGGFSGLLVGSTAVHVSSYSPVPVLVVRGTENEDGPVVVGVDASAHTRATVAVAFAEADRRRAPLLAVHTFTGPARDADLLEGEARRLLAEALSGYHGNYPDVTVTERVIRARPAAALVELSHSARMTVVGARGRGGFRGLVLGSVSHQLLHHAECPVLIVPRRAAS